MKSSKLRKSKYKKVQSQVLSLQRIFEYRVTKCKIVVKFDSVQLESIGPNKQQETNRDKNPI